MVAVVAVVLQPSELQLCGKAIMELVDALNMPNISDTALVFVELILCLLIVHVRPYHCQTVV